VRFVLTPGQTNEKVVFTDLMAGPSFVRQGRGRPRTRPAKVLADKGYNSDRIRTWLMQRGIKCVLPRFRSQRRVGRLDREAYRRRNVVERLFNRLKQFRRIATRYEKRGANYLAMVTIAAILLWL
jgi:transposase